MAIGQCRHPASVPTSARIATSGPGCDNYFQYFQVLLGHLDVAFKSAVCYQPASSAYLASTSMLLAT